MINGTNKDEIIEQFILGKLQGQMLAEFEQKLSFDEEFKKQVELEKVIIRNLKIVGRQEYKLKLKDLHQKTENRFIPDLEADQVQPQEIGKHIMNRHFWLAAASIALLITFSVLIYTLLNSSINSDTVFAAYYQPYPSTQVVRGTQDVTNLKTAAFIAYNEGKYLESIDLFKRALAKEKDEEVLFYLGNAFLSANQPQEAIQTFSKYLEDYQEFEVEANWYLSLSYLKAGKAQEARRILEKLTKNENSHHNKALQLLNDLSSL